MHITVYYFIYSLNLIFEISYIANGKNLLRGIKNTNSNTMSDRCEQYFHKFIGSHYLHLTCTCPIDAVTRYQDINAVTTNPCDF